MSEKLDPEEVAEIVNALFEVLVEPIYRVGGVVDKYIGDALMALFGAPVAHEDDAQRAVQAAWEMQRAALRFSADLEREKGLHISIRVGINTGLVVAGAVGSTSRRADYTVMGDTVNLAQRMEAHAKPGRVLVTAETFRLAQGAFKFVPVAPFLVKGKSIPVEGHELVGPITRLTNRLIAPCRFIGRIGELVALESAWTNACAGKPQLVILKGEAGIGKSALWRKFLQSSEVPIAQLIEATCISYEQGTTYQLLSRLMSGDLGLSDQRLSLETRGDYSHALSSALVSDPRKLALVGHLLGLAIDNPEVASLSPQQLRTGAFLAINEYMEFRASKSPLIIAIEDLQWADKASFEWLEGFLDQLGMLQEPCKILLFIQLRSDGHHLETSQLDLCHTTVELGPLSAQESLQVALETLEIHTDSLGEKARRLIAGVCERATGNPYYTTELARALLDNGTLTLRAGRWTVSKGADEKALPTSVRAAIAARLDRLPVHQLAVVHAASILGRQFDKSLLFDIGGAREADFAVLVEKRILYGGEASEAGFVQAIIGEVAYEQQLLAKRRELHRLAGRVLAQRAARDARVPPATIARHFVAAGDAPLATRYLFLAGERAQQSYANLQAREQLLSALEWLDQVNPTDVARSNEPDFEPALPRRGEILWRLGQLETILGNLATASVYLRDAQADLGRSAEILRLEAEVYERQGDMAKALGAFKLAYSLAGDDRLEGARAMLGIANVRRRQSAFAEAIEVIGRARVQLEGLAGHAETAYARSLAGICLMRMGDLDGAMAEHQAALRLRESVQDIDGIARSLNNLGTVACYAGNWNVAKNHYGRALDLFRKLGDRPNLTMTLVNLGDLLLKQGDDELAERHCREGLKLARQIGDNVNILYLLGNLGEVCLCRGLGREALECLDRGLEHARETQQTEAMIELRAMRGRALLLAGDADGAQAELNSALTLARAAGNTVITGVVERSLAEWSEANGDLPLAQEHALRSEVGLRDSGQKYEVGRILAVLARLLPPPEGPARAAEARCIFAELGAKRDLERLLATAVLPESVALES